MIEYNTWYLNSNPDPHLVCEKPLSFLTSKLTLQDKMVLNFFFRQTGDHSSTSQRGCR